jgi:hypothetical protein
MTCCGSLVSSGGCWITNLLNSICCCHCAGATTLSVNGHKPRVALPVREAVEKQVVRVMKALLLGSAGPKPDTSIAAAFGSVAAAFLRNRCGGSVSP